MNEHIKKLAIEAAFDEETMTPSDKMYTFTEEKMSKFAELIVKECADLCLKHAEYIGPFHNMEFRKGQHFYSIIRNHFGVEA